MPVKGEPRRGWRSVRFRLAYLLLAVFMGLFAYTFLQKTAQIRRLNQVESALSYANQQMAATNAHEQRVIAYDRTPQYVEQAARSEVGYTKPGEIPVQTTLMHPRVLAVRAAPRREATGPQSSWRQWLQAFSP